jgi:hypothetical protein
MARTAPSEHSSFFRLVAGRGSTTVTRSRKSPSTHSRRSPLIRASPSRGLTSPGPKRELRPLLQPRPHRHRRHRLRRRGTTPTRPRRRHSEALQRRPGPGQRRTGVETPARFVEESGGAIFLTCRERTVTLQRARDRSFGLQSPFPATVNAPCRDSSHDSVLVPCVTLGT